MTRVASFYESQHHIEELYKYKHHDHRRIMWTPSQPPLQSHLNTLPIPSHIYGSMIRATEETCEYHHQHYRAMWLKPTTSQLCEHHDHPCRAMWRPHPLRECHCRHRWVLWRTSPTFQSYRISISNTISYVEYHSHCMGLSEYHKHSDTSKRISPPTSQRNVDTMITIVVMQIFPSPLHFCEYHDPQQGRVT